MNYRDDPFPVGNRKQIFIDWRLIDPGYGNGWGSRDTLRELPYEIPSGIRLAVHPPRIDTRPLIAAEHPWEKHISSYITILADEGRFRLYYECYADARALSNYDAMLAYAESDDGVTWRKPRVGAVTFDGSKDNNLVFGLDASRGLGAHGVGICKDPAAPPSERYKLVFIGSDVTKTITAGRYIYGATSPDGLHWTAIEKPLVSDFESDTQNTLAWDEDKQKYVLYCRSWEGMNMGRWHGRRCIAYAESADFRSFPEPRIIVAPDVTFPPDASVYTNSYHRWPGADQAHLLFPALYHQVEDVLDLHLLTSRDGVNWHRPTLDPIIPVGEPGSVSEGGVYAGQGIVAFTPGEWSLPIAPTRTTHNQGMHTKLAPWSVQETFFQRAVWREDGFTSIQADAEGRFTTVAMCYGEVGARRAVPSSLAAGASPIELELNMWSRFGGEIRVELVDSSNQEHWMKKTVLPQAVPGFTFDDCDPLTGDLINHTVTWRGKSDLSPWAGKPIRLRFYLRRARLHAFRFAERQA